MLASWMMQNAMMGGWGDSWNIEQQMRFEKIKKIFPDLGHWNLYSYHQFPGPGLALEIKP